MTDQEIEHRASALLQEYERDMQEELIDELKQLKILYTANLGNNDLTALDLLNAIHIADLAQLFPNLMIGLRIFLTIPASVASNERSFSTLKRVNSVFRSTQTQGRLSSVGVLAVETEVARGLDILTLIDKFVNAKTRHIK